MKKTTAKKSAKTVAKTRKPAKAVKAVRKPAKAKKVVKAVAKAKRPVKAVKVAKRPAKAAKAPVKRVPPRIVRKVTAPVKGPAEEYKPVDTDKAVAFALSIAAEMKKTAAREAQRESEESIRLTRRPTTRAQGKATVKFPATDLREFKKRLVEARAKATLGVDAMKAAGFNESDDHEADGGDGTNQTLRLQALGQMGNINRTIQQIDEALHRIEDGSYGVCTMCGQLIRKPRLLNQPFVLTCMECQSEVERGNK